MYYLVGDEAHNFSERKQANKKECFVVWYMNKDQKVFVIALDILVYEKSTIMEMKVIFDDRKTSVKAWSKCWLVRMHGKVIPPSLKLCQR